MDSSQSDDEFYEKIKAQLNHMEDEEKSSRIISKNEIIQQVKFAPPETREQREINFNYKQTEKLQIIGKVESISKENLIVYSNLLEFVINLDQLLVNKDQEILGKVDDVFGKVERPHYSILMDGYLQKMIEEKIIQVGDEVFINIENASIINQETIKTMINKKGCDASNQFDEEVLNDGDVEYSDDELEAMHKKKHNREDGEIKRKKKKEKQFQQIKLEPQQQNLNVIQQQQQQQQQFMQMQQQQYIQQMMFQQQMQQQQQQYQQFMAQQRQFSQQQQQQQQQQQSIPFVQTIYQPHIDMMSQQISQQISQQQQQINQQLNQQLNQNLNQFFMHNQKQ